MSMSIDSTIQDSFWKALKERNWETVKTLLDSSTNKSELLASHNEDKKSPFNYLLREFDNYLYNNKIMHKQDIPAEPAEFLRLFLKYHNNINIIFPKGEQVCP